MHDSYTFAESQPHGPITEVFDGVFFVTGTSSPTLGGMRLQFSRNMTVIREGDALTLVNAVRLDEGGLGQLEALGRVADVVRLGDFHGLDDAFYVDRYGATLWAMEAMQHDSGLLTDRVLKPGGEMPVSDASFFVFKSAARPEGLILLDRAGGILVSCDALQHWPRPDEFFDEPSSAMMTEQGYFAEANVGPGWRHLCAPNGTDVVRVLELQFKHLLSGHSVPLKDVARERYAATFAKLWPELDGLTVATSSA